MSSIDVGRRDFIHSAAWIGAAIMMGACMGGRLKVDDHNGAPMQGFALKPMKKVRVACIGVGSRGRSALRRLSQVPGTVVAAVADLFQDRIDGEHAWLKKNGKPAPAMRTFSAMPCAATAAAPIQNAPFRKSLLFCCMSDPFNVYANCYL